MAHCTQVEGLAAEKPIYGDTQEVTVPGCEVFQVSGLWGVPLAGILRYITCSYFKLLHALSLVLLLLHQGSAHNPPYLSLECAITFWGD